MIPRCYNRPPLDTTLEVQDGWTADGRRNMITIPNTATDRCATWDGTGIGPNNEPYPIAHNFECSGCRWLPETCGNG